MYNAIISGYKPAFRLAIGSADCKVITAQTVAPIAKKCPELHACLTNHVKVGGARN